MPTYYMIAVDPASGITDLRQVADKKRPIKLVARGGAGDGINAAVLDYYGLSGRRSNRSVAHRRPEPTPRG